MAEGILELPEEILAAMRRLVARGTWLPDSDRFFSQGELTAELEGRDPFGDGDRIAVRDGMPDPEFPLRIYWTRQAIVFLEGDGRYVTSIRRPPDPNLPGSRGDYYCDPTEHSIAAEPLTAIVVAAVLNWSAEADLTQDAPAEPDNS